MNDNVQETAVMLRAASGEEYEYIFYALKEGEAPSQEDLKYMFDCAQIADGRAHKGLAVPVPYEKVLAVIDWMVDKGGASPKLREDLGLGLVMALSQIALNTTFKEKGIDPGDLAFERRDHVEWTFCGRQECDVSCQTLVCRDFQGKAFTPTRTIVFTIAQLCS